MTLSERADALASEANKCCYRSDGYEEAMKAHILRELQAVVEACAEVALSRMTEREKAGNWNRAIACAVDTIRQEVGR